MVFKFNTNPFSKGLCYFFQECILLELDSFSINYIVQLYYILELTASYTKHLFNPLIQIESVAKVIYMAGQGRQRE